MAHFHQGPDATKVLEELLVAYDWGEAFAALNLAVKPAIDAMVNRELAALAEANGDGMLAALLLDFGEDSERSEQWTQALVGYALERKPELKGVLGEWTAQWVPAAREAVHGLAPLFETAPAPRAASGVVEAVEEAQRRATQLLA